jgi:hypothetical protein
MNNLIDVWFTEEQLRTVRFALKDYRSNCGYVEGEEIDSIIVHINHILEKIEHKNEQ